MGRLVPLKPTVNVSSPVDTAAKLRASLTALSKKQVLVGIPEDKANRMTPDVTNAGLLYIHTHGSPLQHIPARPVIEPALTAPDNKALITGKLADAARAIMANKPDQARAALLRAGMLGRNAAIRWFTDPRNGWAPNSPATVAEKGSARPLIDTAQMRRSISYLVEDK